MKQKTEKCANCGKPVVFESGPGTPGEYDVCEDCGGHFCADCMDYSAPNNGTKCKDCAAPKPAHTPGPWIVKPIKVIRPAATATSKGA